MPELPEVETIKMQLESKIVGRKILGVKVLLPKIFEGDKKDIVGATITGVSRRAKILLANLDNGRAIAVHLKMTGQLVFGTTSAETVSFSQGIPLAGFSLPGKTTHVIFDLSDGGKLFFNDNRQFGWVRVVDESGQRQLHEKHGPEPFSKEFTADYLYSICQKWGRPIKLLLMEQDKIAGIGNIYANEALWCSEISPMKRGRELDKEHVEKLYRCILEVLEMGIKYQGSSAKDETYINALGEKGSAQEHFNVYQRQGQKCPRGDGTITMSRIGGRGTFFCPKCQS